jgi:myo-inositol-1(or 4)-monophosphatase
MKGPAMNFELVRLSRIAANNAGTLVMQMRGKATITERRGKDFTTNVDIASEGEIKKILLENANDIAFYGEEGKGELSKQGRIWIVDPIDGIHNYRKACGAFGISITLVENGKTVLGTVYFPEKNVMYQGYEGMPTSDILTEGSCSVNIETELEESTIWTDWTKTKPPEYTLDIVKRLWDCSRLPTVAICATHGLMMVATGVIEGYIHPAPMIEDHAAAGFLVQLAGGTVTDAQGNP